MYVQVSCQSFLATSVRVWLAFFADGGDEDFSEDAGDPLDPDDPAAAGGKQRCACS